MHLTERGGNKVYIVVVVRETVDGGGVQHQVGDGGSLARQSSQRVHQSGKVDRLV